MSDPKTNANQATVNKPNKKTKKKKGGKRNKKNSKSTLAIVEAPKPLRMTNPYKNRNFKLVNGMPSGFVRPDSLWKLTKEEWQQSFDFVMNMLDPQVPYHFPRPIPARSFPDLKSGELFWESQADYVEVKVKPDIFEVVTIRELGITAAVDISGLSNFGEDFRVMNANDNNAEWIGGSSHTISLQLDLPLNNGQYVTPQRIIDCANDQESFYNGYIQNEVQYGYKGLTIPTAVIQVKVDNRSSVNITAAVDWIVYSGSGTVISRTNGVAAAVNANSYANVSSAAPGGFTPASADQYTVIGVRFIMPPGNTLDVNNFGFTVVALTGMNVTEPISTRYYTLGQAAYGPSSPDAALLDNILENVLLWSPCSMSTKLNVDQQLNVAGGRFQTAFLPSFIDNQLSADFSEQWTFIDSRKASYPVAETKFATGAQGSWVPQRLTDVEYRKPFVQSKFRSYEYSSFPQVHILSKKVAPDAIITLRLDFNLAYEFQSTHPAYTMRMGKYHAELAGLLCNLLSANQLLVGENPSHTQRLKKLSKQVLTNPMVQKGFKELLSLGVGLL